MENVLSRFIERNVVDINSTLIKPFNMEAYKAKLSKNSLEDYRVVEFIWNQYGLCSFKKGLFWTINPEDYQKLVLGFNNVTNDALPIIRTVTGSFIIWDQYDDEWVLMYLDIHNNSYEFYGDKISDLFNYDLVSDPVWMDDLNGEREFMALKCFPDYRSDECIVPIPALVAGGLFIPEKLHKVKYFEHLILLAELHDKI